MSNSDALPQDRVCWECGDTELLIQEDDGDWICVSCHANQWEPAPGGSDEW